MRGLRPCLASARKKSSPPPRSFAKWLANASAVLNRPALCRERKRMPRSTKLLWASCLRMSNSARKSHWNVASTLTPPFGIVTVQLFPEKELQPDDQVTIPPPVGVAVSPTEAPTGNAAMHCPGQLMPPVKLVTVPAPMGETCTVNVASEPPPGQIELVGSST